MARLVVFLHFSFSHLTTDLTDSTTLSFWPFVSLVASFLLLSVSSSPSSSPPPPSTSGGVSAGCGGGDRRSHSCIFSFSFSSCKFKCPVKSGKVDNPCQTKHSYRHKYSTRLLGVTAGKQYPRWLRLALDEEEEECDDSARDKINMSRENISIRSEKKGNVYSNKPKGW